MNTTPAAPAPDETTLMVPAIPADTPEKAARRRLLLIASVVSYPAAYYYTRFILSSSPYWGLHALVFTSLFLLMTELFARAVGKPMKREYPFWVFCLFGTSAAMAIHGLHFSALSGWQVLFWHAFAVYTVLVRMDVLAGGRTGGLIFLDGLAGFFTIPFLNIIVRARTFFDAFRYRKRGGKISLPLILSLCLTLVLCIFAWSQLSAADDNFAGIADGFMDWLEGPFFGLFGDWFVYLIFSIPIGAYLTGLVTGAGQAEHAPVTEKDFTDIMQPLRRLPRFTCVMVMAALTAVYALFFTVQAVAFLPKFTGTAAVIPAPTAAKFAVDGFWELVRILILNFSVLAVTAYFTGHAASAGKGMTALRLVFSASGILFCLLDIAKLVLYMRLYGFTPRRIVAGWFLGVLTITAVLVLIRCFRVFPCVPAAIFLLCASFTLLNFLPLDKMIIDSNIRRYELHTDRYLDVDVLYDCGFEERCADTCTERLIKAGWFEGADANDLSILYGNSVILPEDSHTESAFAFWECDQVTIKAGETTYLLTMKDKICTSIVRQ